MTSLRANSLVLGFALLWIACQNSAGPSTGSALAGPNSTAATLFANWEGSIKALGFPSAEAATEAFGKLKVQTIVGAMDAQFMAQAAATGDSELAAIHTFLADQADAVAAIDSEYGSYGAYLAAKGASLPKAITLDNMNQALASGLSLNSAPGSAPSGGAALALGSDAMAAGDPVSVVCRSDESFDAVQTVLSLPATLACKCAPLVKYGGGGALVGVAGLHYYNNPGDKAGPAAAVAAAGVVAAQTSAYTWVSCSFLGGEGPWLKTVTSSECHYQYQYHGEPLPGTTLANKPTAEQCLPPASD